MQQTPKLRSKCQQASILQLHAFLSFYLSVACATASGLQKIQSGFAHIIQAWGTAEDLNGSVVVIHLQDELNTLRIGSSYKGEIQAI